MKKKKDVGSGISVSALFRNYLNLAGIDWLLCEEFGKKFDEVIQSADWLQTDNGTMFIKSFTPNKHNE